MSALHSAQQLFNDLMASNDTPDKDLMHALIDFMNKSDETQGWKLVRPDEDTTGTR